MMGDVVYKLLIVFVMLFQTLVANLTLSESTSIDQAISAYFPRLQKEAISVTRLGGGHSGDGLFLIHADGKRYVLRVIKSSEDSLRCQKTLYAMLEAAKAGVAPQIHFVSQDGKIILMDYIEGGTHTLEQSRQIENRIRFAEGLRRAHAIEKNPYAQVTMMQRSEDFFQKYQDHVLNKQDFREAFHLFQQTYNQLSKINAPHVNIHGDLSPRNIFISSDQVFFIDWFNTYWEDPFLDLSYFAVSHNFEDIDEQILLNDYLQRSPTLEEQKRFQLAKKVMLSRLCLLLNMLVSDDHIVDTTAPLKDYSHYIRLLAHDVELSPQYFYEVSQILLQKAKLVKVSE